MGTEPTTVGAVVDSTLDDLIANERAKKSSMETRGLAVITSSGTLVTLLLALSALATKADGFAPTTTERWLLLLGGAAFVVAAAGGLFSHAPTNYLDIDPQSLAQMAQAEVWSTVGEDAALAIALGRIAVLNDMRRRTEIKARVLVTATVCEVLAVLLVMIAAALLLA